MSFFFFVASLIRSSSSAAIFAMIFAASRSSTTDWMSRFFSISNAFGVLLPDAERERERDLSRFSSGVPLPFGGGTLLTSARGGFKGQSSVPNNEKGTLFQTLLSFSKVAMTTRLTLSTFEMRTGKCFFWEADHHCAFPPRTAHLGLWLAPSRCFALANAVSPPLLPPTLARFSFESLSPCCFPSSAAFAASLSLELSNSRSASSTMSIADSPGPAVRSTSFWLRDMRAVISSMSESSLSLSSTSTLLPLRAFASPRDSLSLSSSTASFLLSASLPLSLPSASN
mmetsp:Transcript_101690/g.328063  ORF Transcript_101690/g.328063 Transcript_101690/m.328063 type:complete len:284 (+) Transcript_101690:782-1633(+)